MTDLDLIRQAAAQMRERATAATPGDPNNPGGGYDAAYVLGSEGYALLGMPRQGRKTRTFVARCGMNDWNTDKQNAEHLAAIGNPAVSLAVADLLDEVAAQYTHDIERDIPEALTVARTYLGVTQ